MKKANLKLQIISCRVLLVAAIALTLGSCGPIQGYAGPKLPDDQTALVTVSDVGSSFREIQGFVGGQSFSSSGIQLLPGKYTFSVTAAFGSEPYQCRYEEEFNRWGYESCIRDREKAIEKNKSKIPYCDYDSYRTSSQNCLKDFNQYSCEISATTEPGARYQLDVTERGRSRAEASLRMIGAAVESVKPKTVNEKSECSFLGVRTDNVTL